jgi:spore maturation protein A
MVLSWIWCGILAVSLLSSLLTGNGTQLSSAALEGAQKGIELAIRIGGSMCLWSGVGRLMEDSGISNGLSRLLHPLLRILFPKSETDPVLRGNLSANICANLLGLGNAATPMGICAAKRLADPQRPGIASDGLCRLVVLNTASIQLIPTQIAAVRLSAGCKTPFDILPAVWLTSICSVAAGLICAWILGKLWNHD